MVVHQHSKKCGHHWNTVHSLYTIIIIIQYQPCAKYRISLHHCTVLFIVSVYRVRLLYILIYSCSCVSCWQCFCPLASEGKRQKPGSATAKPGTGTSPQQQRAPGSLRLRLQLLRLILKSRRATDTFPSCIQVGGVSWYIVIYSHVLVLCNWSDLHVAIPYTSHFLTCHAGIILITSGVRALAWLKKERKKTNLFVKGNS